MTVFEFVLCLVIAGLLFLCAWQSWHHERTMARLARDWAVPEPLVWSSAPAPLELTTPAHAGWGTLMDVAPTKVFRPLPRFHLDGDA